MNILERKAWLNARQEILYYLNKDPPASNTTEYLNNLVRPPIRYYIPDAVINEFYNISCDSKLYNAPLKRFKVQNEMLEPYGFRPLASGTNRRTFYSINDPWIVLKIASDAIGRSDNLSEFGIQHGLLPFCTKVFDVDPRGVMQLAERVEIMTEQDFRDYIEEIFQFLESWFQLGYIFDDVGFRSFKNWGLRDGSGPVLVDFPYLFQYDPDKMICDRIDPKTHEKCGGTIGYNYEMAMSEIVCYKCKVRYSAQYLSKKIDGNSCDIILGRKNKMRKPVEFQVVMTRGNKVVYDPNAQKQQPVQQQQVTIIPSQPQQQIQAAVPQQQSFETQYQWPQQVTAPAVQQQVPVQPQQPVLQQPPLPTPENFMPSLYAQPQQTFNPFVPSIPQVPGPYWQQPKTTVTVETVKDFEMYNRDGKTYIFYPKPLKNDMIQWLRRVEVNYGTEAAMFIAEHLFIDYIPKAQWDSSKKSVEMAAETQQPKPAPVHQAQPVVQQPKSVLPQPQYQTVNMMTRPTPVQTVIAPRTAPTQLKVEDPNHWNSIMNNIQPTSNTPIKTEEHPTTGLEIVQPMTPEEIEAQELKNRGETGMMGYAGIPMVDTMKAKEALPKIKTIVEQKFNGFQLSHDADLQEFQLAQDITRFIAEDIQRLMHDDGKGLLVTAKRAMDTHNNDCFVVRVLNYGSVLFYSTIYPAPKKVEAPVQPQPNLPSVQEQIQQQQPPEDVMHVSIDELSKFFESVIQKFDTSRYNSAENAKKGLITFLCTAAANTFKGQITVPRAMKEATAYVNQAVNFSEQILQATNPPITVTRNNTVAHAL